MDTYLTLRAFLASAETGSFSAAARTQGIATSVLTKRVNQLEEQLGIKLFRRSTRSLKLTEVGRSYLKRADSIVAQIDDLIVSPRSKPELEDFLRIRAPATMTAMLLGPMLKRFINEHPKVRLELIVSENPIVSEEAGFDVSIGARPVAVGSVSDFTLCRLKRVLCASPDYLSRMGTPAHPRDLTNHHCLSFTPTGAIWVFNTDQAPMEIEVVPKFSSNDGRLIAEAAVSGMGITILSEYIVQSFMVDGRLVPLLSGYPLPELWVKAVLPRKKHVSPALSSLLEFLRDGLNRDIGSF